MKLSGQSAKEYLNSPQKTAAITLVYGQDELSCRREIQQKSKLVLGSNAIEEMRLTTFESKQISSEPALLFDAISVRPFFPGPQAVQIYGASDKFAPLLEKVVEEWQPDDPYIFVQAGKLTKNSKLRKLIENSKQSISIGLYDETITPLEIRSQLEKNGIALENDAIEAINAFAQTYSPYVFENFLQNLVLFNGQARSKLKLSEIAPLLPSTNFGEVNNLINSIFMGNSRNTVLELSRANAKGVSLHQIMPLTSYHVARLLTVILSDNREKAIAQLRPPLFGSNRSSFMAQLQTWDANRLIKVQNLLLDSEKTLRSGANAQLSTSIVERTLLKICLLSKQKRGT